MFNSIVSAAMAFFISVMSFFGIGFKHTKDFRVTTYLVASNVKSEESLHAEDFDIITDVILFSLATFDKNGQVHEEARLPEVLGIVRNVIGDRDVKIHINLLGPGPVQSHDDWNESMKDLSAQHKLAFESGKLEDNVVALVNKYDFDGIYFDYEYPAELKDWMIFSKFLVKLDKKLGDKILGCAVSTDVSLTPSAIGVVDRFETMLYDIYDDDGKHASYEFSKQLIYKFTLKGISKDKIDFGLPFYSRPTDHGAYWYGYSGCYNGIDENGYYYDANIDKTFWFNTPDVIRQKTEFALEKGFGGVMIWHYSCDFASSHPDSLLRAVGQVIDEHQSMKPNAVLPPC